MVSAKGLVGVKEGRRVVIGNRDVSARISGIVCEWKDVDCRWLDGDTAGAALRLLPPRFATPLLEQLHNAGGFRRSVCVNAFTSKRISYRYARQHRRHRCP